MKKIKEYCLLDDVYAGREYVDGVEIMVLKGIAKMAA